MQKKHKKIISISVIFAMIFTLFFSLYPFRVEAAANIFDGSTDSNWGTADNWSQGTVPTSTDGFITTFDATSPDCTVDTSTKYTNSIDFTGYTNTITFNAGMYISGAVTLSSTMTIAGSSSIVVNASATLTSNGKTWPNTLTIQGANLTITLADDWTLEDSLILSGTTSTIINGNTLNVGYNLMQNTTAITSGTTNIVINDTGTWSNSSTGQLKNNLTFNTAGTITVSGNVYYNTGTLTYTAGTVVTTSSTLNLGASTTLDTDGITWNNVTFSGTSQTYTLSSDMDVDGTLTFAGATTAIFNGSTIYAGSSVSITGAGLHYGTTELIMNGTGTLSSSNTNRHLGLNLTFNTAGTITIGTYLAYRVGTITYTAGTIDTTTNNSGLYSSSGYTLDTDGITWNNVSFSGTSPTFTLLSDLNISGNFLMSGTVSTPQINGLFNVNVGGNLTLNASTTCNFIGTATIVLNGTGTWSHTGAGTGQYGINITINTAGTITLGADIKYYHSKTITYTAGTVDTTTNSSTLNLNGSTTLDTNGMSWNNVTMAGTSSIFTLTSDMDINGTLTLSGVTATTLNGNTIYVGGDLTQTTTGYTTGTTNFVMNGTGTWSNSSTGQLRNNLTFNTAGTITIGTNVYYTIGTITYTAGTIDATTNSSTLTLGSTSTTTTLDTAGMNWYNVSLSQTSTFTLLSDFNLSNDFTTTSAIQTINGAFNVNVGGDLTLGMTTGKGLQGTATVVMNGTGTWSEPSVTTGYSYINITINTAGTVTMSGTLAFYGKTLTVTTPNNVVTTGSTLDTWDSILDLNDLTLNNLTIDYGTTITVTLASGLKVAGLFSNIDTAPHTTLINSSSAGVQRALTLLAGSSQNLSDVDATDINSTAGYPVISSGVFSNTKHWYSSLPSKFFLLF